MSFRLSRRSVLSGGAMVALTSGVSRGETYPSRPTRWIVGYPPGGTTDVLARIVADPLSKRLGQNVYIDNRPGAGNNIGTKLAVNAEPDGYTLLLVNPANGINTSLYKNLSFHFVEDIAPVAGITRSPNIMEVNPKFPAKTVSEFIDYCKANPGKVNMASSGIGTSVHMSGELFQAMTGTKMLHVPYRGAGPALTDLLEGMPMSCSTTCRRRSAMSALGRSGLSRSPRRNVPRRCPMCRPWPKPCQVTRRAPGLALELPSIRQRK
jgi:tripartite-type tricarboxylate transporter receptor subunit TctC